MENSDDILKAFLDGLTSSDTGNQLLSSSYSYVSSHRALDFLIKAGDERSKGRLVLVGETPYLIMMNYLPINHDATTYNKFISSFKVQ